MSYARFGEHSSVYVYADVGGYVACCGCILGEKWDYHSAAEIVEHMREHEKAGHKVPEHLFDEAVYPPEDFIPMCDVFMCRELVGHEGEHTPLRGRDVERLGSIRAAQIGENDA